MELERALQILQPGWNFWLTDDYVVIGAPSFKEADDFACGLPETLAQWAFNFGRKATLVSYPGEGTPFRIPVSMAEQGEFMSAPLILDPSNPLIEIYTLSLSPSLLREVAWFLEHPEQAGGIVRLADEQQVAMSYANAARNNDFTAGAGVKKAVRWKRTDYWHPQDLADFDRRAKQELEPNNPNSWIDVKWRSFDPDRGIASPNGWIEFVNRSKRVLDEAGNLYSISYNLGMREIPQPVGVA